MSQDTLKFAPFYAAIKPFMSEWLPHVTVATIVPNADNTKFLFVEEFDLSGNPVLNQPAGHLEKNESLIEAAVRETLEETGWHVEIEAFLGIALLNAANGICYQRNTFLGKALREDENAVLDTGIIGPRWLSYEELLSHKAMWRSHLIETSLQQYLNGHIMPLSALYS